LAYVRPMLCLIFLIWAFFFLWGSWEFAKKAHHLSDSFSEKRSRMTGQIVDILGNMNVVRLFTGKGFERKNIFNWTDGVVKTEREFDWVLLKMFAFQSISFVIMQAVGMFYLLYARSHDLITIGDFALTLTINIYIVDNLWNVGQQFNTFSEQLGKVAQGLRMTMDAPNLLDPPNAKPLKIKAGEIVFDHVEFQYRKNVPLFTDLNIHIPAGRKVGLVGYSGGGKTTFVNLISAPL
jgi:ATP-binding cassette subfamily B protein